MYKYIRKKLVYTKRIIRQIIIILLVFIPILFVKELKIKLFLFIYLEYSAIIILYITNIFEKILSKRFVTKARKKLNTANTRVISITGSFGKTSVKTYLYELLVLFDNTFKTDKSYNTPLGISKSINNTNLSLYDTIILEFGASRINDIKRLRKYFNYEICFITSIGENHLDTFKNINNIVQEKTSIIENAKIAFLNYESKLLREFKTPKDKTIISYGINYGDYHVLNIIKQQDDTSFDLYYKEEFIKTFKTSLIGEHNIINLVGVLSYMHFFLYDLNMVYNKIKLLKNVENRLSVKEYDNYLIIDDSFNSNINGALSALDALKAYDKLRFLITSSFVETKDVLEEQLSKYSKKIIQNVDIVILVGFYESNRLYELVYDYVDTYMCDTIEEAFKLFHLLKNDDSILLVNNDLPDIYRKRVL